MEKNKQEDEKVSKLQTILKKFLVFFKKEYWMVKHFDDNVTVLVKSEVYIKISSVSNPPTPWKRDKQQRICIIQTQLEESEIE